MHGRRRDPRPGGRPGGVPPGPWRRVAAAVAAVVTALTLVAPAADAQPTPPAPAASSQVIPLLPPGTDPNDDAAMEAAAQRLVDDPMGRELIRIYRAWAAYRPANISVQWYDFSWMRDDPSLPDWLREDPEGFVAYLEAAKVVPSAAYRVSATSVDPYDRADLYDRLGVPRTGRVLFQVATGSKKLVGHSEENSITWTRTAVRRAVQRMAEDRLGYGKVGKKTFDPLTDKIMQRSQRGLAGQRTPCITKCAVQTAGIKDKLAVVYYGKSGDKYAAPARQSLSVIMPKADAELSRRENGVRKKAETQANANLAQKTDCPDTAYGPGGDPSGGGAPVVAMAAPPLAGPCDEAEAGGLAKALAARDLGGVDFSTLQLRYMSDRPGSGGLRYSFAGRPAAPGRTQDAEAAANALTTSTADLRTWLVLKPSTFWVNLNPTEPDRIVDPNLGRTDAGRALLEADLQMKRTEGRLLDPHTDLGARYWKALLSGSGTPCFTTRLWIVPGDVEVREDGSSLYVLTARLAVKAQSIHLGGGYGCARSDPQADARNERVQRTLVVPKVAEAVNTAPEYAPIRRAFLARVVAQWIRRRHETGHRTSFDDLIDSGDLGPATLQDGWRPRQVFDDYVRSLRNGDFTYKQTTRQGDKVVTSELVFGGVDFSRLDPTRLSAAQMSRRSPRLPQTVQASQRRPAAAPDGSIWLGETAAPSGGGVWSGISGTIRAFAGGRTGILLLIAVALGLVMFGIRGPRRRRRAS